MSELKEINTLDAIKLLLEYKGEFTVKIQDGKILRITGDFGMFPDIEHSMAICKTCESKSLKRFCHTGLKMTEFKNTCMYYKPEEVKP